MKSVFRALLVPALLWAQPDNPARSIPSAVISDPVVDRANPPWMGQVLVPSHGLGMNGLFYIAGGVGPHPTVILLHGFPGTEQNLDLAQAIRRAGWNVLTFHYRGSWGSPGVFSIGHVLEDVDAAVSFVRRPDIAKSYQIDPVRIVLGGHSMGGFAAAAHARHDVDLAGVLLLDAWNVGMTGDRLSKVARAELPGVAVKEFADLGNSLRGATPLGIAKEIVLHRAEWNYLAWGPGLVHSPLLAIGASRTYGEVNRQLAEAVIRAGGKVISVTLPTDHGFQDHRIALAAEVINWLEKVSGK